MENEEATNEITKKHITSVGTAVVLVTSALLIHWLLPREMFQWFVFAVLGIPACVRLAYYAYPKDYE